MTSTLMERKRHKCETEFISTNFTPTPESHVRKSVDEWLSGIGVPTPRRGRRSSEKRDAMAARLAEQAKQVRPWSVTASN